MHTNVQTEVMIKRYITENTSEIFIQVFSSTHALSWVSVSGLLDNCNSKITNVIDAIKVKAVSGEKKDFHGKMPPR